MHKRKSSGFQGSTLCRLITNTVIDMCGAIPGLIQAVYSGREIKNWIYYTIAWFAFPDQRFTVIPAIIVVIYFITIYVLATRQRPQQEINPKNDQTASTLN
jgi:chromate transport protein ChrA